VAHNTKELRCGRSLEKFPEIVVQAKSILGRFMDALRCIDQCFIADSLLAQLPAPSQVGKTKVGGIDLNRLRMRWVVEAVIALSASPHEFTASELARQVRVLSQPRESEYGARRAAYDLNKLRGQEDRPAIDQTRRYEPMPKGLRAIIALGGSQKPSHPALARRRTGPTAVTRCAESQSARYSLRHDSHGDARRLSGAGAGRVNIDNNIFSGFAVKCLKET